MQSLNFLSSRDFDSLSDVVNQKIRSWLRAWTFSTEFLLEIRPLSASEAELGGLSGYTRSDTDDRHFYVISEPDWAHLVWAKYKSECPIDQLFDDALAAARSAFFHEVFDFVPTTELRGHVSRNSSFSDGVTLCITFPGAGKITLYSRQSFLYPLLGKQKPAFKLSKLSSLHESVKDLRIQMQVTMSLGDVPLNSVTALELGGVVRSEHDLKNQFQADLAGRKIFDVALGKQGSAMSVLILGNANDRKY